jgi:hypothetical protein
VAGGAVLGGEVVLGCTAVGRDVNGTGCGWGDWVWGLLTVPHAISLIFVATLRGIFMDS